MSVYVPTVDRVLPRFFLIDHDGDRQILDPLHVRAAVLRQILLHKAGEGLVELPPGLRGDGVQAERGLPGTGDASEDGDLLLGDLQRYVLQIVLRGIADAYAILLLHIITLSYLIHGGAHRSD